MNTWPTITVLDSYMMARGFSTAMVGIAAIATGNKENLAKDWQAQFWEPMVGSTYPALEIGLRSVLDYFEIPLEYRRRSGERYLTPHEYEIMRKLPWAAPLMERDPENGRYKMSGIGYMMVVRALPFFGTQLPGFARAIKNPEWRGFETEWGKWVGLMSRHLTRFGSPVYYSAPREAASRMREISRGLSGEIPERITPEDQPLPKHVREAAAERLRRLRAVQGE